MDSTDSPRMSTGPSGAKAQTDRQRLEKKILDEAPRLKPTDTFQFRCHPGVSCFGHCCADVNIALTPYDVLRLKNRLGLSSSEFLREHTLIPFTKDQQIPVPLLKMRDDEKKSCQFNDGGYCQVYEDRPWACRMYPVGFASPQEGSGNEPFYFLLEEDGCRGHEEERTQTIGEWTDDQGIRTYDEMGNLYQPLALDPRLGKGHELGPKQMEMFWMATYDLDTFRRFVFESSFLDRFEIPAKQVEALREDDEELMKFAFKWLQFALAGKQTVKIKDESRPERTE